MLNHSTNLDLDALLPGLASHLESWEREAIATSIRKSTRIQNFREKETVCLEGDAGECLWIVIEGTLEVYFGGRFIALRGPGSIIGEQALVEKDGVRKATLKAVRPTKLCQLDKAALKSPEGKAAWYKMIAIVLSRKLTQATVQRKKLSDEVSDSSELIGRFVCKYSLSKVQASIDGFADEYAQEHAVIWFSDLVGFTKQIAGYDAIVAAEVIREFMKIQADILSKYDAEIDKFMGDAVMAFWILGKDDLPRYSEIAVNAALEAFGAVTSYAKKQALRLVYE